MTGDEILIRCSGGWVYPLYRGGDEDIVALDCTVR